ncbi:O-antigen ligase family protein [Methylophilaceae bacterium]|nr:O-antigen ligase family protein [Methylophilaceae bacterium]
MNFKKNIEQLLFYLTIFAPMFVFMQHLGGFALDIPQNIITWGFVGIFISLILAKTINRGEVLISKNTMTFAYFVLLVVATYILNHGLSLDGIMTMLGLFLSFLVFLSFQQQKLNLKNILFFLIFTSIAQACIGFLQLLNVVSITKYLHISELRMTGLFGQPNMFAVFLASAVAALYILFREGYLNKKYFYFGILFLNTAIFSSNSRAGMLASIIIAIFILFIHKRERQFILLFLSVYVISIINFNVFSLFTENIDNNKIMIGDPVRLDLYTMAFKVFINNWMTGIGYDNFAINFFYKIREIGTNHPYLLNLEFRHPHNEILYWALMGGVINLFGLVVLLGKFTYDNFTNVNIRYLLLIPILISLCFEHPFINSTTMLVLFMLFICLTENETKYKKINFKVYLSIKRILFVSLPVVSIICVYVSWNGINTIQHSIYLHQNQHNIASLKTVENIPLPLIGKDLLNDKINQTIFNFAVLTRDPQVIEKSLSYWEQRAEKYPKQSFLSKIYHLYYLQQNKEKMIEVEDKLGHLFNKKFEAVISE